MGTGCREEQGGQGRGLQPGDSAGLQELQAAAKLPLPAAARKRQHDPPSGTAALFLGHDRAHRVASPAAVAVLESVRRYLWHGNVGRTLELIENFGDGFDLIRDPPPEVRKLRRYLEEFSRYISNTPSSFRITANDTAMARSFRPPSSSRRSTR